MSVSVSVIVGLGSASVLAVVAAKAAWSVRESYEAKKEKNASSNKNKNDKNNIINPQTMNIIGKTAEEERKERELNATSALLCASRLSEKEMERFALVANKQDFRITRSDSHTHRFKSRFKSEVLVEGGAAWSQDKKSSVLSPSAVWSVADLMSEKECMDLIKKAEMATFEEGDFIFVTGVDSYRREPTGGRRNSATMLVQDLHFSRIMEERIRSHVPAELSDGRKFRGLSGKFLVSRYNPGQYFAAHFDGTLMADDGPNKGCVSAFTVVLYLSDDFEGGETMYLPGQGSEVVSAIAIRPAMGSAVVHRGGTVLHAGAKVLSGTKYITQFGLYYDPPERLDNLPTLKWAA